MADGRRTIVVSDETWERWGELAWKARASRSEYIRRAVERVGVVERVAARASEAYTNPGDTSEHFDALRDILEICGAVEAYSEQSTRADAVEVGRGGPAGRRGEAEPVVRSSRQARDTTASAEGTTDVHATPRPVRSEELAGGAVKREAKAPQQRESDPAAPPPYRVQDLMGARGQELAGFRAPVTKAEQTRRKRGKG